ncbi:MAG: hypothetical protein ACI4UE_03395 [Candidatus Scatovivens sp.]
MKNKREKIEFYISIIILVITSIYIINKSIIYSGAFYKLIIGKFSFYSILIVIPSLVGIIMLFYNNKSIIAKILTILGSILLISSLVTCIVISIDRFTTLEYILFIIFGIIGLLLNIISFISNKKQEKRYVK